MGEARAHSRRESGQAAVEAALTLPLTIFLILGTLQLFLMLQGRLMAEHAAFRAARVGSVRHGECEPMVHAAIAALMPSITTFLGPRSATGGATPAERLANAFQARANNQFVGGQDAGHNRSIVWVLREQPRQASVNANVGGFNAENNFDDPNFEDVNRPADPGGFRIPGYRLEVRLVYWFPMRIPFANWVMATMFRAHFGIQNFNDANPLILAERDANWRAQPGAEFSSNAALNAAIRTEFGQRYDARQYAFPIQATYGMRMFTPPRPALFATQHCPPTPGIP